MTFLFFAVIPQSPNFALFPTTRGKFFVFAPLRPSLLLRRLVRFCVWFFLGPKALATPWRHDWPSRVKIRQSRLFLFVAVPLLTLFLQPDLVLLFPRLLFLAKLLCNLRRFLITSSLAFLQLFVSPRVVRFLEEPHGKQRGLAGVPHGVATSRRVAADEDAPGQD